MVPRKQDRIDDSLRSVDFGLIVVGAEKTSGAATRQSFGESSTAAGDVEIGRIGDFDQPAGEGGVLTGAMLVAANGRLFNCLEVFSHI